MSDRKAHVALASAVTLAYSVIEELQLEPTPVGKDKPVKVGRVCGRPSPSWYPVDDDNLVGPVELVGFARREGQRHVRFRRRARVLFAPAPCVASNCVVAAFVAERPQLLEYSDQRQPLAQRRLGVRRQQPVEAPPSMARASAAARSLPFIRKRRSVSNRKPVLSSQTVNWVGVDQCGSSDRGLAAILAFIAVWRQDHMAAWLFAPTPPRRPLPLR